MATDLDMGLDGLLPCPFCGGEAGLVGIRDGFMVACKAGKPCFARGPSVFHGPGGWDACRADAVSAWNRRRGSPQVEANASLLSQLEYAVKLLGSFPALNGTAQVQSMRETIAKARGAS